MSQPETVSHHKIVKILRTVPAQMVSASALQGWYLSFLFFFLKGTDWMWQVGTNSICSIKVWQEMQNKMFLGGYVYLPNIARWNALL